MKFKKWLNENTIALGDCFRWAAKTSIDKFLDGTLVHGLISSKEHPNPYYHAWIEHNDMVYDWQMQIDNWQKLGDNFYSISKDEFKKKFNILKEKRYSPARAVSYMYKEKNWGPWGDWEN